MTGLRGIFSEFSGAFADLGTFLPIVLAILSLHQMDPSGLLLGFGIFALAVAVIYRRPVPVQPMKVVAAVVITSQLSAAMIAATGLLIGGVLLILGCLGWINRLAEKVPQTLLQGIQMGVGLYLAWAGLKLMSDQWMIGLTLFLIVLILQRTRLSSYVVLGIVIGFAAWSLFSEAQSPTLNPGIYWPQPVAIHLQDLWQATTDVLLPQLALTLTNAVLATAAIASDLFPADRARITPQRLALSTGGLNLLLAPFGAFPMCHGAGGLVVQHRFGARTGLAPAIFGLSCLALGLFLGPDALKLLELLPLPAVGALLAVAGIHLALSRKLLHTEGRRLAVILTTALGCVLFNVAVGLVIGLLAEFLRRLYDKQRQTKPSNKNGIY
ncbi:MAG: molybdate transporter family protein [Candidatus Thiodiazotropha sp.]